MALPRTLTVADLYAMPVSERGERYELIDGALFVTPAPTWEHQTVSSNLFFPLATYIRSMKLGWVVATPGVHVDERTYVIPDLVFIARERRDIIGEANIEAGPDLVVEILSPSTRRNDLIVKRTLYSRIGVREYWLVEPETQTVTVLTPESGGYVEVAPTATGIIRSQVLPGLHLTLVDLFEDVDIGSLGDGSA
jgi:Uma2 family endonuclease